MPIMVIEPNFAGEISGVKYANRSTTESAIVTVRSRILRSTPINERSFVRRFIP